MPEERPLRVCDVCGTVDDHPRVRHMLDPESVNVPTHLLKQVAQRTDIDPAVLDDALAELLDPVSACRHFDCCAGTGCAICRATVDAAHAHGKTGASMLKALQNNADAVAEAQQSVIDATAGESDA
jgi:hypothetical protein